MVVMRWIRPIWLHSGKVLRQNGVLQIVWTGHGLCSKLVLGRTQSKMQKVGCGQDSFCGKLFRLCCEL
jgi:hypothetical protein